jgi:hypothetical protein
MREPIGGVLRHAFEAGFHDWQVRLEVLRLTIVILVLSRLFLEIGLYFEMVFMQPDAAMRYPRRSYPVDFLTGLLHFMTGAALTTVMTNHLRMAGGMAMFSWILLAFLSIDILWLGLAVARGFSAMPVIAGQAKVNVGMLVACAAVWAGARMAGRDTVFADQLALGVLAAVTVVGILRQIRIYEGLDRV